MESFIIEGGHQLRGTIKPQGAKNEALQVICATLLTSDVVRIANVPDILDVRNLNLLMQNIGVKVKQLSHDEFSYQADQLNLDYLGSDAFVKKCSELRGSVMLIGALLGRFGKATVYAGASAELLTSGYTKYKRPKRRTMAKDIFSPFRATVEGGFCWGPLGVFAMYGLTPLFPSDLSDARTLTRGLILGM